MAQSVLKPAQTWVFAVGVLEWKNSSMFASFEKKDRLDQKIVDFFTAQGIPAAQVKFYKDQAAVTQTLNTDLTDFASKGGADDVFIFYYAGHGYKNAKKEVCLASYDAGNTIEWGVNGIVNTINQKFKGKLVFLLGDCCNSGGLSDAAKKLKSNRFIGINSVYPADKSTGNWTYSNVLLSALKGESYVDVDNNRQITCGDVVTYLDAEMGMVEKQKAWYYVPDALKNTPIASCPAKSSANIGVKVWVNYDGVPYLGFIVGEKTEQYQVRFYSYTNHEVEWIDKKRCAVAPIRVYAPNTAVQVAWKDGKTYTGKVVQNIGTMHFVHYDGYDASYDDWVHVSTMTAKNATINYKKGDKVKVLWKDGKKYSGTILKVEGMECLVRYEDYDAAYNDWNNMESLSK